MMFYIITVSNKYKDLVLNSFAYLLDSGEYSLRACLRLAGKSLGGNNILLAKS